MPSTPLMACSSGVVTADSTVCALAPVYTLVTVTCGGASCGYCATGSRGMHTAPAITMNSEHTVANTGRLMKKSTNTPARPYGVMLRGFSPEASRVHHRVPGVPVKARRRLPALIRHAHRRSICQALSPGDNYLVAGLDTTQHGVTAVGNVAHLHRRLSRHRSFTSLLRYKSEVLSANADHRSDWNHEPRMRTPHHPRPHKLRRANFPPRVSDERLRQHRLHAGIHLRRNEGDARLRQHRSGIAHDVYRQAQPQLRGPLQRHLDVGLQISVAVHRGQHG